jgi:epoxyqueuosine reductase QueG
MRAEAVAPSPIGLLVHPDHGLWHAYRAALLLDRVPPDLPARDDRPSPCATCVGRPCLTACPVGAHAASGFDVTSCATHVRSGDLPRCLDVGCRSREACPIGRQSRFGDAQVAFHMRAFERAV